MNTQLTPAQHAILAHAHHHSDGKIIWFPDNIKGGARKKMLDGDRPQKAQTGPRLFRTRSFKRLVQ
ncbi:hypothetical protein [Ferrovum sp.]|uniref:hypothetical protein n=1 Tax=Ferrovum sp. TaxID=2609467 RepID=UPI002634123D|nr:hypothetical protein [Ferrovum sp.]